VVRSQLANADEVYIGTGNGNFTGESGSGTSRDRHGGVVGRGAMSLPEPTGLWESGLQAPFGDAAFGGLIEQQL